MIGAGIYILLSVMDFCSGGMIVGVGPMNLFIPVIH